MLSVTFSAAILLLTSNPVAADGPTQQSQLVEEIVAKVNGEIITRGELEQQRLTIESELQRQGLTGQALREAVNERAADELRSRIDTLLLVQKGKELSINVDAEVNRNIAALQSKNRIADPDQFHDWLSDQFGISFEDFKQRMKDSLIEQRVIGEEVYRNVVIPKAEIEKYYNEHKTEFIRQEIVSLREILISTGEGSADQVAAAEIKAKGLVDRMRKGEAKFTDLARQYSDASTATAGGELGAFSRGDLAKEIDDIVFRQSRGYVTDPIRRPAGFEIYRVEEHNAAGQASDEVENEINARLMESRTGPKVREYLTQLRENAFLQIKPGFADSGAAPGKDTTWQGPGAVRPETTTKEAVAAHGHKRFLRVIPYGHMDDARD
jgi:peptidyl-prolyl cis-trans isomerase SurA